MASCGLRYFGEYTRAPCANMEKQNPHEHVHASFFHFIYLFSLPPSLLSHPQPGPVPNMQYFSASYKQLGIEGKLLGEIVSSGPHPVPNQRKRSTSILGCNQASAEPKHTFCLSARRVIPDGNVASVSCFRACNNLPAHIEEGSRGPDSAL